MTRVAAHLVVAPEVVLHLTVGGFWVVTNPAARTHLLCDHESLELLRLFSTPRRREEVLQMWGGRPARIRDVSVFPHADGLLADPTGIERAALHTGEPPDSIAAAAAVEEMERLMIVVEPGDGHRQRYGPKQNILDRTHVGNMHQWLGQYLRLNQKLDPEQWWVQQKFLPDLSSTRPGLYRSVEEAWIRRFFAPDRVRGLRILDVGCGVGYFAHLMASAGAEVLGIDPSDELIDQGRRAYQTPGLRLESMNIADGESIYTLPEASFDIVLMSDVLLFYFTPPDGRPLETRQKVLRGIRRALRPDGRFYSIEPHGVFFHALWFGAPESPVAVLTEYRNHRYRVVPTLEELSAAFQEGGFVIRRIFEPDVSEKVETGDERAYRFAQEFPVWWVFELQLA